MVATVQIKRTIVPNSPPASLLPGELAVEMDSPTRLWVGVPPAQHPDGRKLLFPSVSSVIVSDTAPTLPEPGTLWWESDTGVLWLWYEDVTSAQWVQVGG